MIDSVKIKKIIILLIIIFIIALVGTVFRYIQLQNIRYHQLNAEQFIINKEEHVDNNIQQEKVTVENKKESEDQPKTFDTEFRDDKLMVF